MHTAKYHVPGARYDPKPKLPTAWPQPNRGNACTASCSARCAQTDLTHVAITNLNGYHKLKVSDRQADRTYLSKYDPVLCAAHLLLLYLVHTRTSKGQTPDIKQVVYGCVTLQVPMLTKVTELFPHHPHIIGHPMCTLTSMSRHSRTACRTQHRTQTMIILHLWARVMDDLPQRWGPTDELGKSRLVVLPLPQPPPDNLPDRASH